jgi:hypothetical protein
MLTTTSENNNENNNNAYDGEEYEILYNAKCKMFLFNL